MKRKDLEKKIAANRRKAFELAEEINELTDQLHDSRVEHFNVSLKSVEEVTKESIKDQRGNMGPKRQAVEIDTDERRAFLFGYMIGWVEVMAQIDLLADIKKEHAEKHADERVKYDDFEVWDYYEVLNRYLNDIYMAIFDPEKADKESFELAQSSLRLIERALQDVDNQKYPFRDLAQGLA